MSRFPALLVILLAPLLASCLSSPSAAPDSVAPLPDTETATDRVGDPGAGGGGILLHSDRLGRWCSCDDTSPVPGTRQGLGVRFTWTVADPVAVDRFAEFRALVDGQEVLPWGTQREWPAAPELWFPDAGMHVFTVEKSLNGVVTTLEAEFEVFAR